MRLLIVSHTPHYRSADHDVVGFAPTVRELDELAADFREVVHVAPLYDGAPHAAVRPYRSGRVRLVAVPPAGGPRVRDKLGIGLVLPRYAAAIRRELPRADVVHVRCPANIALVALGVLVAARRHDRVWVKYAGDWNPGGVDPLSYRLQRRLLASAWPGWKVTINGRWPAQPAHVETFPNPCLSEAERQAARSGPPARAEAPPWRLLFVGALEPHKGPEIAVEALAALRARGYDVALDLVGGGGAQAPLAALVDARALTDIVRFHGWLERDQLGALYQCAHLVVLPSRGEGWPKVLSEGMAYGAVPVATQVGSIGQVLAQSGCGTSVPERTAPAFAAAIEGYLRDPARWQRESLAGVAAAEQFTYERHRERVARLMELA